jgi:trans-AT polyketide synthase, acyltransferase and oxidoreductase domains
MQNIPAAQPQTYAVGPGMRQVWLGSPQQIEKDEAGMRALLQDLSQPAYVVRYQGRVGVAPLGPLGYAENGADGEIEVLMVSPALSTGQLGDPSFMETYGTRYAYYAGAMANGIASADMVIALGKAGYLGSFGSAGMVPPRLEEAIRNVQAALPDGPYAFNLIHSPNEESMEWRAVELFLQYGVTTVEASAFLDLTPSVVQYRAAGLQQGAGGEVIIGNRIIAKLSRTEVATKFMQPAPAQMLNQLVAEGRITQQQAQLAGRVPMADDVCVEADSGGHTDNRPMLCLLPTMIALRNSLQAQYQFEHQVRVGAGGGISTPHAALGAFMMGAAFIVTGSVNQACVEAGASEHTRKLLAKAGMADVIMAPSADMFEMGVKVQVLKSGTFFPMRAQKLYDTYMRYASIDDIPADERQKMERQIFQRPMEDVWADTVRFFEERDPEQITRANDNPKRKMALIFRWYLGLSSRWSNSGEKGREMDYQIWCGPSMGSFNDWTRGSYLEEYQNRHVASVANEIMTGCAYLFRLQNLKMQGLNIPSGLQQYAPGAQVILTTN